VEIAERHLGLMDRHRCFPCGSARNTFPVRGSAG
jgi:hypothetical protein